MVIRIDQVSIMSKQIIEVFTHILKECIPQNIILKAPSAELTNNQTDEASLGIDYATLDAILYEHIDNKKDYKDIVFAGFNPNDVTLVLSKVKKSEYKRRYEPPCPTL